jgi:hypothetical protein
MCVDMKNNLLDKYHLNCKASPGLFILQDSKTVLRLEYLNQNSGTVVSRVC